MNQISKLLCLSPALFSIIALGCGTSSNPDDVPDLNTNPTLIVEGFPNGGAIPQRHTCDGEDSSPAIEMKFISDAAQSLVLIVDDPDAPMGTWNHWILYDLPPNTTTLPEKYAPPSNVKTGANDFGRSIYSGPCPPAGAPHRYFFRLYALSVDTLGLLAGATRAQVDSAMEGRVIAEYPLEYMGTYGR
ncbi:MAG: YbhB/YbcL family Raf kinase inhibitor-like protein [Nitrospinota bacterium]|nr:YbhB/YbcL family Raf kinase inhibitor-like protein [Nitrospinota bacterium]